MIAVTHGPSVSGSFELPDSSDGTCSETLRAEQAAGGEYVDLAGTRRAQVTYADRARLGHHALHRGAFLCAGERLPDLHVNGGVLARTLMPNAGIKPSPPTDPTPSARFQASMSSTSSSPVSCWPAGTY